MNIFDIQDKTNFVSIFWYIWCGHYYVRKSLVLILWVKNIIWGKMEEYDWCYVCLMCIFSKNLYTYLISNLFIFWSVCYSRLSVFNFIWYSMKSDLKFEVNQVHQNLSLFNLDISAKLAIWQKWVLNQQQVLAFS